jgi:hypothetical protein
MKAIAPPTPKCRSRKPKHEPSTAPPLTLNYERGFYSIELSVSKSTLSRLKSDNALPAQVLLDIATNFWGEGRRADSEILRGWNRRMLTLPSGKTLFTREIERKERCTVGIIITPTIWININHYGELLGIPPSAWCLAALEYRATMIEEKLAKEAREKASADTPFHRFEQSLASGKEGRKS